MTKRIGTVFLHVANLDKQVTFYQEVMGLRLHRQQGQTVFMGVGGEDLLALIHAPDNVGGRGSNGLYHFALLVPSRYHLALTLRHFITEKIPLQGMSDHLVSEAIYLADPEGNGIEVYTDRPKEAWYVNGQFQMATLSLDVHNLLAELQSPNTEPFKLPRETIMGHVHLHVDNLQEATAFYRDTLAMQVMFAFSTASFLSYDGYHHHIGINTWAGEVKRSPQNLGLSHFVLFVDSALQEGLEDEQIHDASGNAIHIQVLT